jgi:SAM-dependent methyltransferase
MNAECPYCGSVEGKNFLAKEHMFGQGGDFTYRQCADCGSLRAIDPPERLDEYYPTSYYSQVALRTSLARKIRARLYLSRLSFVVNWNPRSDLDAIKRAGFNKKKTLLDVGCGSAAWLVHDLRALGYSAVGIDPYIQHDVSDNFGLSVKKASIDTISDRYDVIIFRHSLEHVPNPIETLRQAADRLSPGGTVIVCVPIVGWAWTNYGVDWVQLDAPRHFSIFTDRSIELIAEKAGLFLCDSVHDSTDFQFWGSDAIRAGRTISESKPPKRAVRRTMLRNAKTLNDKREGDSAQYFLRRTRTHQAT